MQIAGSLLHKVANSHSAERTELRLLYRLKHVRAGYTRSTCSALIRMSPLSMSYAEGFLVISCRKVEYDKSSQRSD
jgi:hypothetical protein